MIVRNVLVETRVFHHVADCNGSYDQNHILRLHKQSIVKTVWHNRVRLRISTRIIIVTLTVREPSIAPNLRRPNRLDSCGVCDQPSTLYTRLQRRIRWTSALDDCGTCDEDPNNDRKIIAHLPATMSSTVSLQEQSSSTPVPIKSTSIPSVLAKKFRIVSQMTITSVCLQTLDSLTSPTPTTRRKSA